MTRNFTTWGSKFFTLSYFNVCALPIRSSLQVLDPTFFLLRFFFLKSFFSLANLGANNVSKNQEKKRLDYILQYAPSYDSESPSLIIAFLAATPL